ncbi:MAG TPA: hypothetical protein PLQ97_09285 [Myxococcota bacterium]|nr:hypothetical protein [Myxococcota bacterium]HQK50971.1 hypothetical protein [Myxococcota bacterium]
MDRKEDIEEPGDLVVIADANPESRDVTVVRPTPEGVVASVLKPVQPGQPLLGDMVRLEPLPQVPILARMRTVLRHPDARAPRGPSDDEAPSSRTFLGSTDAYRRGWEAVFGRDGPVEDREAN